MMLSRPEPLRYRFGPIAAMFLIALSFSGAVFATAASAPVPFDKRSIAFYHTHTGERLEVVYFSDGRYRDNALHQINHFLRDFRTGDMAEVDPATLDIVHAVQQQAGHEGEVHIVSAFRSAKTNEMLRAKSSGVAKKSQHPRLPHTRLAATTWRIVLPLEILATKSPMNGAYAIHQAQ